MIPTGGRELKADPRTRPEQMHEGMDGNTSPDPLTGHELTTIAGEERVVDEEFIGFGRLDGVLEAVPAALDTLLPVVGAKFGDGRLYGGVGGPGTDPQVDVA